MALLACQRDARARALDTEVLGCEPVDGGFDVVLADTVLYPEGGGQPADRGTIAGVPVLDVQRVDGRVRHRTTAPVALGPARVEVDWARRFDLMQQHTAQHLLTAVAQDRFGWATTSFHLHASTSDVELDVDAIPDVRLPELEESVNAEIRAARPVVVREVAADDLDALAIRTRGLPDGMTGPVRLVEITGIDVNTCGGTHVANTAELGAVKLLRTERLTRGTRLHFLAGGRVRRALGDALALQRALGQRLSAGAETLIPAVDKALADAKAGSKAITRLQRELAFFIGAQLGRSGERLLVLHRGDGDLPFLDRVCKEALDEAPDAWLFLTGGTGDGVFLVHAPPDVIAATKPRILELLAGRGGGRPGRLQGRAGDLARRGQAADLLRARLP